MHLHRGWSEETHNDKNVTLVPALNFKMMLKKEKLNK